MKLKKVHKLSPRDRLFYWIEERHRIHILREAGAPKPWTDDEILQNYFFTNPYREDDKTTRWFRAKIRNPWKNKTKVVFATIAFRWFNLIRTGEILKKRGYLTDWNHRRVLKTLSREREDGNKIFTGAYMINSPGGERKLEAICRRVTNVWDDREALNDFFREHLCSQSLETAHEFLTQYDGLGGFMAYEVVCDLRYTKWLEKAHDVLTWCNPGPGCIRGLYRIAGEGLPTKSNATSPPRPKDWLDRMEDLLDEANERLAHLSLEMREIEHSLCEFDKYERARTGDGKLKRKYPGA